MKMFNIPNTLTILRFLIIPFIIYCYYAPYKWLCAALFVLASLTDGLDGYLARRLNQVTQLGIFLDPIVDKLLVISVLILLISDHHQIAIPGILIIFREIIVSSLRGWAAQTNESIPVSNLGKAKTLVQMVALPFLLVGYMEALWVLWLAVFLSWWSICNYVVQYQGRM